MLEPNYALEPVALTAVAGMPGSGGFSGAAFPNKVVPNEEVGFLGSSGVQNTQETRSYFPETWLWLLLSTELVILLRFLLH